MPLAGPGVLIPSTNNLIIPPSISVYAQDGKEIGFISDIAPDHTRRAERIRVLKASAMGRPIEQVPSPEDITIRVTGFAIYTETLVGGLTKGTDTPLTFHSLNTQYIPFYIRIIEKHPISGIQIITKYGDCWLVAFSHPMSVGRVNIAETASIQPSWVETVDVEEVA